MSIKNLFKEKYEVDWYYYLTKDPRCPFSYSLQIIDLNGEKVLEINFSYFPTELIKNRCISLLKIGSTYVFGSSQLSRVFFCEGLQPNVYNIDKYWQNES